MKITWFILAALSFNFVINISGQTNNARLYIPFLDKDSQSNAVVKYADISNGKPCPEKYTNSLSNTNLFSQSEIACIRNIFVKYKSVTTNSGPAGTIIVATNNAPHNPKSYVINCQYTNCEATETIKIGYGLLAEYRDRGNNGYDASFIRTGGGTLLSVDEIKNGQPNGLLARFNDLLPQGLSWDYRLTDFKDNDLQEYSQNTNGMVFGKFLMWNVKTGKILIDADFDRPYDMQKHVIKMLN
jgi:hypothetical protein